ncbi:hemagglutinin repeat-containing protein [Campylobacter concisus]|uniref:hemagglutinin repeat-containing protein n=4 Tax=Campylobacter concisus TaxID=199 RepID=UPI00015C4809|nr:hemagglutinin repeat-containing protein [Campylobacter concisus]
MGWLQCNKGINKKSWRIASAAALASSGTYGFSVGVRADLATTKQESSLKQTSSNKSSLNAKRININSTKDISITGSDLASKEDMSLNSNNLNINSSEDSLKYKSHTKSLTTGFGFTFYGANSSSLELGTNSLKQSEQSLTNNNSHLYSAKDMNINTANDATIKGANLRADERLNLKVGNNLSLESVRDKYAYNERGYSVGVGIGFSSDKSPNSSFANPSSTKATSTNANFSRSRSNTITKQTVLSSITANELNVEVGKNTHLKGSLLAAGEYDKDNTFIDNHNLNLKTNTLSYENLSNTSYAKGTNFSIGANYILEDKNNKDSRSNNNQEDKFTGLKSIDLSNHRNLSYTLSKNLATLGSGNIEIADKENSDDLTRLNRDTTKLTKDLVNTSISSNVDASMDLRVLTKSGQKDIAKEITSVANSLDNLNRYIKDSLPRNKLSEEKANEIYKEISNNSLGETIVNIFKQQGLDNEQIENLMSDRDIISLIKSYNTISSKTLYSSTDNLVTFDKDGIPTINVTNTKEENFYDFVIKGAKAIDTISKAIGESNAVAGIFVIQVATQGLLKTAISVASNEVKDNFTKGIKEGLSEYIANDLLDINNKGNDEQRKQDIKLASDLSASVSIDIFVGGAYSIVRGSKNVVKADEKLKESNVNSNAIAKSNAELKSNEHNLNNKNSSDGVAESDIKATSEKIVNEFFDIKNINTFKNANIKDVEKFLDKELQGWTKEALKKGDGVRYTNGKGGSFELNKGYANPKDDIHGNPYLKATVGSEKVRIPLK